MKLQVEDNEMILRPQPPLAIAPSVPGSPIAEREPAEHNSQEHSLRDFLGTPI